LGDNEKGYLAVRNATKKIGQKLGNKSCKKFRRINFDCGPYDFGLTLTKLNHRNFFHCQRKVPKRFPGAQFHRNYQIGLFNNFSLRSGGLLSVRLFDNNRGKRGNISPVLLEKIGGRFVLCFVLELKDRQEGKEIKISGQTSRKYIILFLWREAPQIPFDQVWS